MQQGKVLRDAIICDIDGTLANLDPRLVHLPQEGDPNAKEAWNKFYAGIPDDTVIEPTKRILEMVRAYGDTIIMLTGRDERFRIPTVDWLAKHNIPYDLLLMRPDDNRKPDHEVKHDFYVVSIAWEYNIKFVLEDRASVVKMWREQLGLHCLQNVVGDY